MSIFNTSAKAWYGLASSIGNETFVSVANGKWNKQSCLEKALTFDEKIKPAWIELGQILPDDTRTGCAYVSMQRVSRQSCYEKALELDLDQYEQYHDSPPPNVSESNKLETAKLWCLFGSSLKAGVWITLNGEALDQQRCFFKALALDIYCEAAWTGLGFIALESSPMGIIRIPIEPSKTIEIDDEQDEHEQEKDDQQEQEQQNNDPSVPVALKRRSSLSSSKKKNSKLPKYYEFSAAECFERGMDAQKLREGIDEENEEEQDGKKRNDQQEEQEDREEEVKSFGNETLPDVTVTASD